MAFDLLGALVTPSPAPAPAAPERSLTTDVQKLTALPEAASLVPAAFLGLAVLDAIPTPTDIGFFWGEEKLRENENTLSPRAYWAAQVANYYGWDVLWYSSLFAATTLGGTTFRQRAQVGASVVGLGALATLLWRYSHPDTPKGRPPRHRKIP